jgi:hypothetical protein
MDYLLYLNSLVRLFRYSVHAVYRLCIVGIDTLPTVSIHRAYIVGIDT